MRGRVAWRRELEIENRFYLVICIRILPDVLDQGEARGFQVCRVLGKLSRWEREEASYVTVCWWDFDAKARLFGKAALESSKSSTG